MISKRQEELLYIIVQEYISTASPIGSKFIINKYMKNLSAATIRNDMAALEKKGYITKVHNSSGRVPSIDGYKYYEKNFNKINNDLEIQKQLKKIFNNRSLSINEVIDKSVSLITETFKLPTVISEIENNILLKRIDLVVISKNTAAIILITSDGNVLKNLIDFENEKQMRDISVCIRVFNDRLIDKPINRIEEELEVIQDIIRDKVEEYEFIIQEIVQRIFKFNNSKNIKNRIEGQSNLLIQPEFNEKEKLISILKILENSSVWEMIALKQQKSGGKTSITFSDEIDKNINDISVISTDINLGNSSSTCISLVGPTRMDYTNAKSALEFIKVELEKIWKE